MALESDALRKQAEAVAALTEAAALFFKKPSADALLAAGRKHEQARRAGKAAKALRREDLRAFSLCLSELSDQAGWAVVESERFAVAVEDDKAITRMAAWLREAVSKLCAALESSGKGRACAGYLIEAKRAASEIERLHRKARGASLDDPRMVVGLKTREIYRRLSQAAEAAQKAADRLGEMLAVAL